MKKKYQVTAVLSKSDNLFLFLSNYRGTETFYVVLSNIIRGIKYLVVFYIYYVVLMLISKQKNGFPTFSVIQLDPAY